MLLLIERCYNLISELNQLGHNRKSLCSKPCERFLPKKIIDWGNRYEKEDSADWLNDYRLNDFDYKFNYQLL